MAEYTTQSQDDTARDGVASVGTPKANDPPTLGNMEQETQAPRPIVWTPRFIVVFFLTLVVGLSVESLLTEGWLNGTYKTEWVLLGHTVLILACLVALIVKGRSTWIRMGAIFGCIWAVFTGVSYIAPMLGVNERSGIALEFQAAISCALLGTYICLSTHNIPFRRWDSLFFWLAPLAGGSAVAILYALARTNPHHTRVLISATITVLLWLSVVIWWLRPSCWRSQPCITFLFGLAPLLMFIVPSIADDNIGTPLFVGQVLLLCILLGVMRVVQGEIRQS